MKEGQYCYEYPRPALTVDVVLFRHLSADPEVLLIRRGAEPYRGKWAFPGGYVEEMEPLEAAARRELREETGIEQEELRQIGAFGDPGRDPRGHTVSVAFAGIVGSGAAGEAADDAAEVRWVALSEARDLAFDHDQMLARAREVMGV